MNEILNLQGETVVSLESGHDSLHGKLTLLPGNLGIVVLVHATRALDGRDEVVAGFLRHAGFSTLSVELLSRQEEHFPDAHNHVPLLAQRLIGFLEKLKHPMTLGSLPVQPLGLCAANDTTPVAVRVAALRDHDIAAIVCRGGLIDRAGVLYLRTLESPLLHLVDESDQPLIASSRRALEEIPGLKELRLIPEIGVDFATSPGFETSIRETVFWFKKQLGK